MQQRRLPAGSAVCSATPRRLSALCGAGEPCHAHVTGVWPCTCYRSMGIVAQERHRPGSAAGKHPCKTAARCKVGDTPRTPSRWGAVRGNLETHSPEEGPCSVGGQTQRWRSRASGGARSNVGPSPRYAPARRRRGRRRSTGRGASQDRTVGAPSRKGEGGTSPRETQRHAASSKVLKRKHATPQRPGGPQGAPPRGWDR